ncbi:MAG: glycosyltransferase [Acidobacteriaceae bacterium]|nr:glycosyltransferase [Acidobacteriaceae bacterium]
MRSVLDEASGIRRMTVLSVGYPLFPVRTDESGGAEQILVLVERGLVESGNRSVVVAAQGSSIAGRLIATPCVNGQMIESREKAQKVHARAITKAVRDFSVDLIHFHGLDFHTYVPDIPIPMLATLHLPLGWYPDSIYQLPKVTLNCVSHAQANGAGFPVVLNGIDTQRYRPAENKQDYLLWLGRVCPEKGAHIALEVAHRLDLPIIIAGPLHPFRSHHSYFNEKVKPLLDDKRRYIGPVHGQVKADLLAAARCLLVPSLVAETSSLVAMEAITSGTAVVAFRSGALPEVIEHGNTGFIVDTGDEMVDAVSRIGEISPKVCRARGMAQFDARRMIRDYLNLYRRLCERGAVVNDPEFEVSGPV